MDTNTQHAIDAIDRAMQELVTARGLLSTPETFVPAGGDLAGALAHGGRIRLEAGATYAGTFRVASNTQLIGAPGVALRGSTLPVFTVPPGTHDVEVVGLEFSTGHMECVSIGENTTNQTTVEAAPANIAFRTCRIPLHKGRRAFAIHGQRVELNACEVVECYDPAGSDSQAIYVGNAPGDIAIFGGRYSAGSEIVLSGGDSYKIPNNTPDGIRFEGVELFRPLSWRTDGIKRKVKNLFEIKNGKNIAVKNCTMHGNWADGQDGTAILLTPALDGAVATPPKRSGEVFNVTFEDLHLYDCGSCVNSLGRHYTSATVNPLTNVVFRRGVYRADHLTFGGRGQLFMTAAEPGSVLFDGVDFVGTGSSTIYHYLGTVMDPATLTTRPGGKWGSLTVQNCRMTLGPYGFWLNNANAVGWANALTATAVTGNMFGGPATMKAQFPTNTYLDRTTFDAGVL